ncbi:MAG TPA: hypothetical protein VJM31_08990 [Vicinamibacterales bacterium]|nr:hypothetical protein [Vicinamibacterales bacterium]
MLNHEIHPTTMVGIKRLAKQFRRERGIKHTRALDEAAIQAGFSNFRHAQLALADSHAVKVPEVQHKIFLTGYWRDKQAFTGRETLTVDLASAWDHLVAPERLRYVRALGRFRQVGPQHLEMTGQCDSQSSARRQICAAARTFHFMDATGLKPSKGSSRAFPGGAKERDLPARDHGSFWFHPASKKYLYADEPYEAAADSERDARAAWVRSSGFAMTRPKWQGMYNPDGGSQLYLFAHHDKGLSLGPITAALDALTPPFVESDWNGESAPVWPYYVAPILQERVRPARKRSSYVRPRTAFAMSPGRKLLVTGLNHVVEQGLISLAGQDEEQGHVFATLLGRPSVILWNGISAQELRLSVWWDYDHSNHPQANLGDNMRERFQTDQPLAKERHYPKFVAGVVSGWVERKTGRWLQGEGQKNLSVWLRPDAKETLREVPNPVGNGFDVEGRFFL